MIVVRLQHNIMLKILVIMLWFKCSQKQHIMISNIGTCNYDQDFTFFILYKKFLNSGVSLEVYRSIGVCGLVVIVRLTMTNMQYNHAPS